MPGIAYSRPADAADLAPSAQHVIVSSATHAALRELLGSDAGLLTAAHLTALLELARDELPGRGLVEVVKVLNGCDAVHVRLL
jgi:hypothetical protein